MPHNGPSGKLRLEIAPPLERRVKRDPRAGQRLRQARHFRRRMAEVHINDDAAAKAQAGGLQVVMNMCIGATHRRLQIARKA